MEILGVCGSLRAGSTNLVMLQAAASLAPPGVWLGFDPGQLGRLPHFNPDLDGEGETPPPEVAAWRARLAAADAVLIITPEYAHGAPGALKNALDWLVSSGELTGKPTALLVAGPGGGDRTRQSLRWTLEVIGANVLVDAPLVLGRSQLGSGGRIDAPQVLEELRRAVNALASAAGARTQEEPSP